MQSTTRRWTNRLIAVSCLSQAAVTFADPQSAAAADADEHKVLDTVIVTGSNIRRATEDSVAPLQVLEREDLTLSNAIQFSEILRDIPANTGSQLYNESGLLNGTAQFELRGLGFSSTLVLVNGRRAGVAPLSDKSGSDFLDINQFPLSMVERVEVLKDGASAIYGSEAVAGVVNIITRRGFEGFELSADYQTSTNEAYTVSLATGKHFDRGSFNVYATYLEQTANKRSDFDWLIERVGGNGVPGRSQLITANGYPGTYYRGTLSTGGDPSGVANAVGVPDPNCEAAGGVFRINDNGSVNRTVCNANFADQTSVIPAQRRLQAFAETAFDITDAMTYFNEISVSSNLNMIDNTVGGFSNGAVENNVKGYIYVPADHPFNFFVADPANPNRVVAIDISQWNPAMHTAVPVVGNFRPEGQHYGGEKRQKNDYLRTVNGMSLRLGDAWSSQLSHAYSWARFEENDPLGVNAQSLASVLESGQYNPFGTSIVTPGLISPKDGVSVAGNSPDVLDRFFYTANSERRTHQHVVDVSASGPVLDLPVGAVSAAVGAQYRDLRYQVIQDSLYSSGGGTSPSTISNSKGRQDVVGAYAEMVVPFHDRAELQLAVRHEDYGDVVGSSTDPKIASRIEIFDGLAVRGSWGTSFQAPTLTQQSVSESRVIVNDPVVLGAAGLTCSGTTVGSNATVITSGEGLRPQVSENFNFGVDIAPLDSLNVTADFWHYRYSDLIAAAQNAQAVVSGECVNGVYVRDPRVVRGASGQLNEVSADYVNVGKVVAEGIDVATVLRLPAGRFGDFRFRADATYIQKFDVYGSDGRPSDKVGSRNFTNNFAPMPQWRASATVAWNLGMQEASISTHFTDGYRNDQSNNAPIESFTTLDAQYSLTFDDWGGQGNSTTVSVGVDNVFDEDPPSLVRYTSAGVPVTGISAVDRPGYDALSGADIRGRIVYARFLQQF
jgi:iron complex outermembrane receptor protein